MKQSDRAPFLRREVGSFVSFREINEKEAIELYLSDLKDHPDTVSGTMPIEDFIEFLRDTEPDWVKEPKDGFMLKPLEIHEVPSYV